MMKDLAVDLRTAARFMLDPDFSLDADEAVRIGIRLAELAGMTTCLEPKSSANETNA